VAKLLLLQGEGGIYGTTERGGAGSGWFRQGWRKTPVRVTKARRVAVDGAPSGGDDGGGGRGGAGQAREALQPLLHVPVLPTQQGSHASTSKIRECLAS